mgnify:CR=1 FL=1
MVRTPRDRWVSFSRPSTVKLNPGPCQRDGQISATACSSPTTKSVPRVTLPRELNSSSAIVQESTHLDSVRDFSLDGASSSRSASFAGADGISLACKNSVVQVSSTELCHSHRLYLTLLT